MIPVVSDEGIHVSRLTGHDTKTCGKVSYPCHTISYGIQQLSTGLYIYLDGTNTLEDPYTCEALDPGQPGIYLNKSVSFVGIKTRAYISCLHGNAWLANGMNYKGGIRVSFSRLAFLDTSVRLFDAFVAVEDTVFAEAKFLSLDVKVINLPRFKLSLNNVVFKKNLRCLAVRLPYGSDVVINITNTVFSRNGNPSSALPLIYLLNSNSESNLINTELRNCSFKKNTLKNSPMILFINTLGTTNVLLSQIQLVANSQTNRSIKVYDGAFRVISTRVFLSFEYGSIFAIGTTFLSIVGHSAEIYISNIDVNGFFSSTPGGGVFDAFLNYSCSLLITHSSFRNGKNSGNGGIVSIDAPNSMLIIQNSTIHNVSSLQLGAAVFINSTKNAHLRIINSSFLNSSALDSYSALVFVHAKQLLANVSDSSFLRNRVTYSGSILFFYTHGTTTIGLHNNYFQENNINYGGIVHVLTTPKKCSFNFLMTNNLFVKNTVCKSSPFRLCAIVNFTVQCIQTNVHFKNLRFIGNSVERGSCINVHLIKSKLHFATIDGCIFKENVGLAMFLGGGDILLTCEHSIFDSNRLLPQTSAVMILDLKNSTALIRNTTFVNNFGPSLSSSCQTGAVLKISDSAFVRNKILHGPGTLTIFSVADVKNIRSAILIKGVLFQENVAATGSALYITSGTVLFKNCTFLDNFAIPTGALIISGLEGSSNGITNLFIYDSIFRQTIKTTVINRTEFVAPSFLTQFKSGLILAVNTSFDQNTKSDGPLILITGATALTFDNSSITLCPSGHAIERTEYIYKALAGLTFSCEACDYNFYSLQRGTARGETIEDGFQCLPCPRGADCDPTIRSKTNYWGYHVSLNPPKLAFTICPFGYCKSPPTKSTEYNACQGKRTGVMCGMCSQGYTEALWSTYCTPVKECNDYWFWILFLVLVSVMAIILVFKPPFVTYCLKQILWFRKDSRTVNTQTYVEMVPTFSLDDETPEENISLSSTEQQKHNKRQFSRFVEIIFYFYQIAQLLLSSSSLKEFFYSQFLNPVLGFFNFQPSFTKQGFLCPFPGLTPETKLVFKIAPVFGTLIAIFFIYAVHSIICRTRGSIRPAIAPYFQAGIKTIFLGYASMATVSISLIRCVFVADETRWFYNGNITCYQWWQYASITFIAIFVIPFILVLTVVSFKLNNDKITTRQFLLAIIFPLPFLMLWLLRLACSPDVANVEENQNVNALKEMLLAPYSQPDASKRGAIYWQSVLIARRFILVLIFCIVAEPSIRLFCMTIVCVVVLCCHLKVKPFQNSLANNFESVSLFFLIILGLINLFKSEFVGFEQNIKGSLITVLKVFRWLETAMLGLFPAILLLLLSFAVVSFSLRVVVVCCRSIFKFFFRPCAQRWMSRDSAPLFNVCDDIEDEGEEYVVN